MIRKLNLATLMVTTVAGNNFVGGNGFLDGPGRAAQLSNTYSLTVSWDSSMVLGTDVGTGAVRAYYPATGMVKTVAGFDNLACNYNSSINLGPATSAQLCWDDGIGVDAANNLYVYYSAGMVAKINSAGIATRYVGADWLDNPTQVNNIETVPGVTNQYQVFLCWGAQVAVDPNTANLYIADYWWVN